MISWTIGEYISLLYILPRMKIANKKKYDNISEEKISYGEHADQYLLLFEPKAGKVKNNFIFFLHGGGWRLNNPAKFRFVGNFFAEKGYVTVSAGYRYVPEFCYPTQINDAFLGFKKAFTIVDNKYSENKGTIIIGSSSGAHLGSIAVYDKKRQDRYKINQNRIKGFVSNAGPLNFQACQNRTITRFISDFLGESNDLENVSPIEIIKSYKEVPNTPLLCIHGDQDPVVEYENSTSIVNYINTNRNTKSAEIFKAEGMHHSDLSVYLFLKEIESQKKLIDWLQERE